MAKAGHFTDGYNIRISLVNQGITVYEKNVTPDGVEGGDPINITTNDNGDFQSFAPRSRKQRTPSQSEVTYNETDLDALDAAVDQSDDILIVWPDDTTRLQSGWLRSNIANQTSEGEQPTTNLTFEYQGEAPV